MCVCVLIVNAVVKLFKKAVIDWKTLIIFLVIALGSFLTPLSPAVFVVIAAIAGIVIRVIEGGKK